MKPENSGGWVAPTPSPTTNTHTQMLGQIANEVEEYCCSSECTTLDAVRIMKAKLKMLESAMLIAEIESSYK